jgi:hypothetical protein
VGSQPAGDPIDTCSRRVDRTQCCGGVVRANRARGLTVSQKSCMRSSHAPRTRNPEPRVRVNRKTESRKTDSGTGCRKTPSSGAGTRPQSHRNQHGSLVRVMTHGSHGKVPTAVVPAGKRASAEREYAAADRLRAVCSDCARLAVAGLQFTLSLPVDSQHASRDTS